MKCSLKTCPCGKLDFNQRRVEVKSPLPKGGIGRFRDSFIVQWDKNGEAMFHQKCWESLLFASNSRKGKKRISQSNVQPLTIHLDCEKEMIWSADETAEMFDTNASVLEAAARIAKLIKASKHCVVFTGAGISTSAGLGDYRGKDGKWTEQDREATTIQSNFEPFSEVDEGASSSKYRKYNLRDTKSSSEESQKDGEEDDENEEEESTIEYEALRPTYTHEAIEWLVEADYIKYVVSQNCDGLHLLSGIPPSKVSELHGNVFVEHCEKCEKRYVRPFYVCDDVADIYLEELEDYGKTDVIPPKFMAKCRKCGLSHRTGRICEVKGCRGHLQDTIINFGDHLEEPILDSAFTAAKACDLMICLGTTLTVRPASNIVDLIKRPHRIIICNRQPTERDRVCSRIDKNGDPLGVRVYTDCDVLMKHVMSCILEENNDFDSRILMKKKNYDALRKQT